MYILRMPRPFDTPGIGTSKDDDSRETTAEIQLEPLRCSQTRLTMYQEITTHELLPRPRLLVKCKRSRLSKGGGYIYLISGTKHVYYLPVRNKKVGKRCRLLEQYKR